MADKELSDLTSATTLDGTELFYLIQSANSRKVAGSEIVKITHNQAWSTITGTPTTLSGYGIADAATAAQGALADSAVQPADLATVATTGAYSDLTGTPTLGTAAATDATAYATALQGATADSALQPSAIGDTVQAHDDLLDGLSGLTPGTDGQVIGFSGGAPTVFTPSGSGDMLASTYDPQGIAGDVFDRANHTGTQPLASVEGAISANDVPIYGTATGVSALAIPAGITAFRTNGYAASGDKGGAIYDEVGAAVTGGVSTNGGTRFWAPRIIDRVDPRWYGAKANGVDSDVAAVRTAYGVSRLHGVFVYLSTGQWVFDDYITSNENDGLDIRGDGKDKTIILHRAVETRLFSHVGGDVGEAISVTSGGLRSNTLTIADNSTLSADEWFVVQDPDQPVIYHLDGTTVCDSGQLNRVRTVKADTTKIEAWSQNEFQYGSNSTLRPLPDMIDGIRARGMTIKNETPGSLGLASKTFALTRCRNLDFRDIAFEGLDEDAIALNTCVDGDIDIELRKLNDAGGFTPYGVACGPNVTAIRIKVLQDGGRHSVTCGADVAETESAHVIIHDSIVHATDHSAYDTHPGARGWKFIDCIAYGAGQDVDNDEATYGAQIRGRQCEVTNLTAVGYNRGVYLVGGEDNVVYGLDARAADIAVSVTKTPGAIVKNVRSNSVTNTVLLDDDGADVSFNCSFDDITERGAPPTAFNFVNFPKGTRVSRLRAPNAEIFSAGISSDALYGTNFDGVHFSSLKRSDCEAADVDPLSSGVMFLTAVWLDGSEPIRKLWAHVQSAGAGQTNFWMALYDKDYNLLTQTTDKGSTAFGTGTQSFGVQTRVQPDYAGLYYVAIMQRATTMATFSGKASQSGITGATPKIAFTSGSLLTDTAPATATPVANGTAIPFVGVSS